MEDGSQDTTADDEPNASLGNQGRVLSNTGLFSKLPFMRPAPERKVQLDAEEEDSAPSPAPSVLAMTQQHKTRRRRGSLRKVALLGRGAQRDRRDGRTLTVDTYAASLDSESLQPLTNKVSGHDALGLTGNESTHYHVVSDESGSFTGDVSSQTIPPTLPPSTKDSERKNSYTSTTDEEDVLQIPRSAGVGHSPNVSSGHESYYTGRGTGEQSRSFQQAKSPLSYSGMTTAALPQPDSDWDYSETEWWGWVVLAVTWFIFVVGMGSCLKIWTWAWDVGKTPYAPPELEDDPTLPVVGYYPALIILTGVMAWVWVVVAWVGMKYFRHAKISGD